MVSQAAGLTKMPGAHMPQAPNFGNLGQRLDKGKGLTGKAQKKLAGMGYTEDQISQASQAGGMEGFQNSLRGVQKLPQTSIEPTYSAPTRLPNLGGSFPMPGGLPRGVQGGNSPSLMPMQGQPRPGLDANHLPADPQAAKTMIDNWNQYEQYTAPKLNKPFAHEISQGQWESPTQPAMPMQGQWISPTQPANGATSGKVPGMYPGMPYDDYMKKINNNEHVGYEKSLLDMSNINFSGGYPNIGYGTGMPSSGQQQTYRRPGRINTLRQGMMM